MLQEHAIRRIPQSDNMLHTGMLKGFMDGSLGSQTAALLEPYGDDPGTSDCRNIEPDEAERDDEGTGARRIPDRLPRHRRQGRADGARRLRRGREGRGNDGPYGDRLDRPGRAQLGDAGNFPDFRFRIEHAQVTTPQQIAQFKELKVIASMQPSHLLTDMNWAEARLGPKRAAYSYAWAAFLKKGVVLAFGTDYPVEPVTPFRGLYAAVTRKSEDGKKEYYPEQKLTIEQAIAAYTTGSAFAEFAEKEKGKLAPGMLADLVVLDTDITSVSPEKVLATKVLRTVLGGKTVYQAK